MSIECVLQFYAGSTMRGRKFAAVVKPRVYDARNRSGEGSISERELTNRI